MSSDLGRMGHLPELITLTEPRFDVNVHGLPVGNNLIKANIDLGQLDAARKIVDAHYALKRPDWAQTLGFWDNEIAKARVEASATALKRPANLAMLAIEGPIWLKPGSPAAPLFGGAKPDGSMRICFLGATAETENQGNEMVQQMADAPGRVSRALPLYLAEQTYLGTDADVRTLVPWIVAEVSAFVLSGQPWDDEFAAHQAREEGIKADYIVLVHLIAKGPQWEAKLRLVRTIDGICDGELSASFSPEHSEWVLPQLAQDLLALLADQADVVIRPFPPSYEVPADAHFAHYMVRLEQLLAASCAGMEPVQREFLSGERTIIDGNIQLCVANPANVPMRLLLIQTLVAMKRVRPEIIEEFRAKIELLQKDHPLPGDAQEIVQKMIASL